MAWIYLVVAGLLEVAWATGMKYSEGFSRAGWTAFTLASMILSFALLSRAMQDLPLGTAYTVWTGIGAVGSVLLGILLFGEPAAPLRLFFIGLIVAGIAGLRYAS